MVAGVVEAPAKFAEDQGLEAKHIATIDEGATGSRIENGRDIHENRASWRAGTYTSTRQLAIRYGKKNE